MDVQYPSLPVIARWVCRSPLLDGPTTRCSPAERNIPSWPVHSRLRATTEATGQRRQQKATSDKPAGRNTAPRHFALLDQVRRTVLLVDRRIWTPATSTAGRTLVGHTGGVVALAVAPNGSWLASAGDDGEIEIRIWDPITSAASTSLRVRAACPTSHWRLRRSQRGVSELACAI